MNENWYRPIYEKRNRKFSVSYDEQQSSNVEIALKQQPEFYF